MEMSNTLNENNKGNYQELNKQLDDLIEQDVKGVILRSLCPDYEEGEKCTKYFFSFEKYRAKQKAICRLKTSEGDFVSDQKSILTECKNFYQKLYDNDPNVQPNNYSYFYDNPDLPRLNSQQKYSCEQDLSMEELHKTLQSFQKNKAPGLDGITAEFYLKFWPQIGRMLFNVYEESFHLGTLPHNMRVGLITLLEKKAKTK